MSSNLASRTTAGIHKSTRAENMAAFDKLPPEIRQALANADHNWSARQFLTEWRKPRVRKYSAFLSKQAVIEFIKHEDRKLHNNDSALGIVLAGQRP
jgi:hypothetical protein